MISDEALIGMTQPFVEELRPDKIISVARKPETRLTTVAMWTVVWCAEVSNGRRALMREMDRALWGRRAARVIVVLTPEEYERDGWIPRTVARPA